MEYIPFPGVEASGTRSVAAGHISGMVVTGDQTIYNISVAVREAAVPGLLPRDVPNFTGREDEVTRLVGLARGASVVVSAVDGTAGAGKTALVVHTAHMLLPEFPDGQLYADLQGYTEGQAPAEPREVLERFLTRLGISPDELPSGLEERSDLFRHILSRRRLLVILDNVASESQARPLLPGEGSSLVLITSRGMLPGLELDARIGLDVLPDNEAAQLLTRVIGKARSSADRAAVQQIVTWCGGLPLALRIAGQILSVHPRWPVSRLATMLADEQQRLGRLSVGDRQVRTAFQVSYGQLSEAEARLFRFLGLHPGRDFDVAGVASLAGIQRSAAEEILDRLVLANLVVEEDFGRFRMHDLLRLFSRETCQVTDDDISRREALARGVTYYANLATFLNSCIVLQYHSTPAETSRQEGVPLPSAHQAITWFEVERYNLLAALSVAVEEEWHER